jgi:hypothetical protein
MARSQVIGFADSYENEPILELKASDEAVGRRWSDRGFGDAVNDVMYLGTPAANDPSEKNDSAIASRTDTQIRTSLVSFLMIPIHWVFRAIRMHREDLAIQELECYDWRMAAEMRAAAQRDLGRWT